MIEPDEIVEVPGRPHTFGLVNAHNMLRKLEWEVDELARRDAFTTYRAFNAAVTAWHLIDWVWRDLPDPRRRSAWRGRRGDFQSWCVGHCSELGVCGLIANASKHGGRDRASQELSITTVSIADVVHARFGTMRAGDPFATWTWRLTVRDGEQEHMVTDVFTHTLTFWRSLIAVELPAPASQ